MLISNHVSPANILQISDVIHGIVFLLFVLHFTAVVRLFLLCEKWEIFSHFLLPYQNKATSPPGFLGRLLCTIDDIFQISQRLPIWSALTGYKELAVGFESIRKEKCLKWIILIATAIEKRSCFGIQTEQHAWLLNHRLNNIFMN